jgi:hypothetical protein
MQKFDKIVDVKISLKEGLLFNEINNFRYEITEFIIIVSTLLLGTLKSSALSQ